MRFRRAVYRPAIAAADLHQQDCLGERIAFVICEFRDDVDAVLAVLLRPVRAGLTCLSRGTQVANGRRERPGVGVECDSDDLSNTRQFVPNEPMIAPGPIWQFTHSSRECGEFWKAVYSGVITVWHVTSQKVTELWLRLTASYVT